MRTIREANKSVSANWQENERERNNLISQRYDSDDDSPGILRIEARRQALKDDVEKTLNKKTIFSPLTERLPRSDYSYEIRRREDLAGDIERNTNKYIRTTGQRRRGARSSSIMSYAFKSSDSVDLPCSTTPVSLSCPLFTWTLRFKKLQIAASSLSDVWTDVQYDEISCQGWWQHKHAEIASQADTQAEESPVLQTLHSESWADITRLARRFVIHILETVNSPEMDDSRHIIHVKMIAERTREIILYEVILCYNLSQQWLAEFQELVEYTVPIIYLVSEITKASSVTPAKDIARNVRIQRQLQGLDPYVRELRNRCYLFGNRIGFDVYRYEEEFNRGAIFNFDEGESVEETSKVSSKRGFDYSLDRRLAGNTTTERINRISGIGQKQVKVRETIVQTAADNESRLAASSSTQELGRKVFEEIGLNHLDDIIYEPHLRGSGGYADVYEMKWTSKGKKSVAVKIYRPGPKAAKRLEREARIWIKIRHQFIAPLLGFVVFDSVHAQLPCLVSEMFYTDLKRLIRERRKGSEMSSIQPLTELRKLEFLRDVVYGLDFLHAMSIAHGDLRAANVLVTNDQIDDASCYAVLNDFGMAEYDDIDVNHALDDRDLSSVNQRTNDCWLAPELIKGLPPRTGSLARVSKAGDVYAFGVVYLEVIYEKNPYDGTLYDITHAKSIGELPAKKEELEPSNEDHWALMECCWNLVEKRWDVVDVACALLRILGKQLPYSDDDCVVTDMSGLPDGFTQYRM